MITKNDDLFNFEYMGTAIPDITGVKSFVRKKDINGAKNYLINKGIKDEKICNEIFEEVAAMIENNGEDESGFFSNVNNKLSFGTPVYSIEGCRGRHLEVFEDFIVITVSTTIGSVLTGNVLDGQKIIFYKDCIGIQYKPGGSFIGYLQLETASSAMNNGSSNFFNENTFTFDNDNNLMKKVSQYIFEKVYAYKK